eukprot:4645815-Heterocapsa_arctica.AAC.1
MSSTRRRFGRRFMQPMNVGAETTRYLMSLLQGCELAPSPMMPRGGSRKAGRHSEVCRRAALRAWMMGQAQSG